MKGFVFDFGLIDLYAILAFVSIIALLAGLVSIIYPLRFLEIQTRKRGLLIAFISFWFMLFMLDGFNVENWKRQHKKQQQQSSAQRSN